MGAIQADANQETVRRGGKNGYAKMLNVVCSKMRCLIDLTCTLAILMMVKLI